MTIHPLEFLGIYVYPSVFAWKERPLERFLAINAFSQIDIMVEVIFEFISSELYVLPVGRPCVEKKPGQFRERIAREHNPLGIIRDIHDAHKHGKIVNASPNNVTDRSVPNELHLIQHSDGNIVGSKLAIQLGSGYNRPVESILLQILICLDAVMGYYLLEDVDWRIGN